mmetsp:Transcript_93590/g.242278  ORF Transcript_93590/g.242278 Transcript_93590/m.242278 type:complete len:219 (-) Transcript_93590:521-1177(-)
MDTPEPMFTKINGKSGSGQGSGSAIPSSPTVNKSPCPLLNFAVEQLPEPPVPPASWLCGASSSNPSTTAESSRTGCISTRRASRKSGANLHAPPPAVATRRIGLLDCENTSSDQSEQHLVKTGDLGEPCGPSSGDWWFTASVWPSMVGDSSSGKLSSGAPVRWKLLRRRRPRCCTDNSSCKVEPERKRSTKRSPLTTVRFNSRWLWARPLCPNDSGKW